MSTVTINPIKEFQADHKLVRDLLFDIIKAAEQRDAEKALEVLLVLDKAGGPHFRFEEESLYPALEQFFGKEYHEYLLSVHDRIINAARDLAQLLGSGEISEEDAKEVPNVIRNKVLPHPIECDGLTLLAEKLSKEEIEKIALNFQAAREADIPLLEWAASIRERKAS